MSHDDLGKDMVRAIIERSVERFRVRDRTTGTQHDAITALVEITAGGYDLPAGSTLVKVPIVLREGEEPPLCTDCGRPATCRLLFYPPNRIGAFMSDYQRIS